jgi:hypothetical protein
MVAERIDIVKLRFSKDDRIEKVSQIMTLPIDEVITTPIAIDLSPEEISNAQQTLLKKWSHRVFSLSVGRGMFNYSSAVILSTDRYDIKNIPTSVKVSPTNTLHELIIPPNSNIMDWADFHLGVSAGLEIRGDCKSIDSSWIVFNQTRADDGMSDANAKHGIC